MQERYLVRVRVIVPQGVLHQPLHQAQLQAEGMAVSAIPGMRVEGVLLEQRHQQLIHQQQPVHIQGKRRMVHVHHIRLQVEHG